MAALRFRRRRWKAPRSERRRKRRRILIAVAALLVAAACAATWALPRVMPALDALRARRQVSWAEAQGVGAGLDIYFLDVGQADAAILTCDGAAMVIDGGNVEDAGLLYNTLHDVLHISHIDHMIATHPHEDHVGGLSGALRACTVGAFYTPVLEADNRPFEITLQQARERGARIVVPAPGGTFALGGAQVEILGPRQAYEYANDMSIICRVTYGKTAFLFCGDAERRAEQDLVDSGVTLSADVLKVGHHGSGWSSNRAFLRKVRPRWAVISVGENDFNLPAERALSRLRDIGAAILRTDESGTLHCASDGAAIRFSTLRDEQAS